MSERKVVSFSPGAEKLLPGSNIPPHLQQSFLRQDTQEGLALLERAAAAAAQQGSPAPPAPPVRPPAPTAPPAAKAAEEGKAEAVETDADDEDMRVFGRQVDDVLHNKALRDAIEERCPPISLDALVSTGRCMQTVPVVPGVFEPTFQTPNGAEELFIKRVLSKERGSELYLSQKLALMTLAVGLVAINDRPLPDYEKDGRPDEELFAQRFEAVSRYPSPMLASLQVNFYWFDRRTRKLFSFR